jgi:streptomycin 6-kinase
VSATHGDAVLKVGWTHDEARDEAAGLRVWDGNGAVRLLAEHVDGETTALLLERATPGTTLAGRPGPEQDVVVTGLLRRLWIAPPVPAVPETGSFRPLAQMCDAWASAAEPQLTDLDPGLRRKGLALFRALPRDDVPAVLLVTDLHAGNVLAASREPWLVIDPKPYVGDPAYDVLQHLLNDPARLTADPLGFVARVAGLAGLDADRVEAWLLARCVVEAVWWPYDTVAVATALHA